jgi:hypothetical protein
MKVLGRVEDQEKRDGGFPVTEEPKDAVEIIRLWEIVFSLVF